MDWLAEHWAWLAGLLAFIGKFAQDHLRISQHEDRIKEMETSLSQYNVVQAQNTENIKHIRYTMDAIAERQGITEKDVKDMMRRGEN